MALKWIADLAAVTDGVIASFVSAPSATRAAVDARVRAGVKDAVADAVSSSTVVRDAAVAAMQDAAVQAQLAWQKAGLTSQNLADVTVPGVYVQATDAAATTVRGYPISRRGTLTVTQSGNTFLMQRYEAGSGGEYVAYSREQVSGVWSEWVQADARPTDIPSGIDLDTYMIAGRYSQAVVSRAKAALHYPSQERGLLTVTKIHWNPILVQKWETASGIWMRQYDKTWGAWSRVGGAFGYMSQPAQREMRLSEMRKRLGRVSTGGKAAVALICDHGNQNFQDIVLPALQARGLTATLALNVGQDDPGYMHAATNGAVGWDVIAGWAAAGVEIANHTRNHRGVSGLAAMLDNIVTARDELEAKVGQPVDSWVQIGVPSGDPTYDGFGEGKQPSLFWTTDAGRMILDSHPVVSGTLAMPDGVYPLDGNIPIGAAGTWIDAGAAVTNAKALIDRTITKGGRSLLRLHPHVLTMEGQTTPAMLDEILDYLEAKRDLGELRVLTFREWAIAGT